MSTHHTESKPRKRDKFKNFFRKITGRSRAASRGNAPEPVSSSSSRNSAASQPGGPPQRGNDLPASSSIPIAGPGDHSVHIYGGNTLPSQGGAVTAAPDPSPSTLPASAPTSSNIVRNEDRPPGSSTSPSALPASQPTSSNDPVRDENRSPGASPSASPVVTVTASEPTSSNNARDEGPPPGSSPSALPVAEPTASNDGAHDGDRDTSRIVANLAGPAKLAWHGLQLFLKKAETSLDGTPAKLPVGLLNRLIEIGTAVSTNQDDIRELFARTSRRLDMINDALLNVQDDGVGKDRIEKFAGILIPQLEKLDKMECRHLGIRVVESDEDKVKVKEIFKRLDECAKDFHIDISLSIERKTTAVFNSLQKLHLDSWPRSRQAVYNADLDSTTLTRQPCTPGTRTAIIDAILEWAKDSTSAPVYWLNGMAGTGKSTIAYSICQRVEEMGQDNRDVILAASFFCSRQIEDARRRKYIIPTIVYQLARRSRSYAEKLLDADFDAVDVSSRQMKELLVGPWHKSGSKRPSDIPPRLVIVDALDENDGGSQFLKDLLEMVEEGHLRGLKFLVTSRPDPKIVAYCNGFQPEVVCHLHEVKPEDVQSDILTFMMVSLPTLSDKPQLKELGRQAGGLFIYAATVTKRINFASPTPAVGWRLSL